MENATKALLIAAAVLIAILIISLGLVVYNMASETIDSVNFSSQEITAFNDKFTQYEGKKVRGSEVNAMLKTVLNSNMQSRAEGLTAGNTNAKFVCVNIISSGDATDIALEATATSLTNSSGDVVEAKSANLYNIEVDYNATTGFVDNIRVSNAN